MKCGRFVAAIESFGEEAVTLLRGSKGTYRALVADVRLRGRMDGWQVARQAREIDPGFPIGDAPNGLNQPTRRIRLRKDT